MRVLKCCCSDGAGGCGVAKRRGCGRPIFSRRRRATMHFVQVPPTFQHAGFTSLKQHGAEERIGPEACCLPTFQNVGFASLKERGRK